MHNVSYDGYLGLVIVPFWALISFILQISYCVEPFTLIHIYFLKLNFINYYFNLIDRLLGGQ